MVLRNKFPINWLICSPKTFHALSMQEQKKKKKERKTESSGEKKGPQKNFLNDKFRLSVVPSRKHKISKFSSCKYIT